MTRFRRLGPFALLSNPGFRLLWFNCLFLQIGFHLAFTAQAVVAFDITGNNRAVGFVTFAQGLALLITTPFIGVLADRFAKRVLIASELALLSSAAAMSALIFSDAITIGFLAAGALFVGLGISSFWPAINASMVAVTDPESRPTGAGLFQVAVQLTRATLPFLAAALISVDGIGGGGAYLVVALVYVPVVGTALLMPGSARRTETTKAGMLSELRVGLRYVASNRPLLKAMLSFILVVALGFSINVVLPGFTREVLGAGKSGFGIMFGFNALGALIASTVVASHGGSPRAWSMLLVFGVGFGLTLAATGVMPSFWPAVAAMFVAGAFGGGFQTLIMGRIFHLAEPAYLGRVTALTSGGWSLTNLVGLGVGGLGDLIGERAVLVLAGLGLVMLTLALSAWTRTHVEPVAKPRLAA